MIWVVEQVVPVHIIAPGPATTPTKIVPHHLHPPIDTRGHTRGVCSREIDEPLWADGRRCVAHHGVPLQKGLCKGRRRRACTGVELKRGDPDPGLLDGDDEGGEGTARG